MICPLCGCLKSETILQKQAIPIFTNAEDVHRDKNETYPCRLLQCINCGHVFQQMTEELEISLEKIYRSDHAQITTPLGFGNWGKERALYLLEKLKRIKKHKKDISILEIGCGNGYVLKALKKMGFHKLVGVEPSIEKTTNVEGILFIKEFVDENFELGKSFDFIFSFGVYEHIKDINGITKISEKHLKENGELFIYVPDCMRGFDQGELGIFAHQHIQYFVASTLRYHLRKHGFDIAEDFSDRHALAIIAKRSENVAASDKSEIFFEYQKKIDYKLENISKILSKRNLIVHGACNALNNILGWIGGDIDFTLVDNDTMKHGKKFFNKYIHSISMVNLDRYNTVFIVPTFFSEAIINDYKRAGFKGEFQTID